MTLIDRIIAALTPESGEINLEEIQALSRELRSSEVWEPEGGEWCIDCKVQSLLRIVDMLKERR